MMDQTVIERLDRVERENRRLKMGGAVALAVIAAVVLMGQAVTGKVAKVVEAEKFVLRDKSGLVRGTFSINSIGTAMLGLNDETGTTRATFGVTLEGSPIIGLTDAAGRLVILGITGGSPGLTLADKGGKVRANLYVSAKEGLTALRLYDTDTMLRGALGVADDGSATLGFLDKHGKVNWSAP